MITNNEQRFLGKDKTPTLSQIEQFLGSQAFKRLNMFDEYLNTNYDIVRELKFPFGNQYGWSYKYSCKSKMLCYVFFEKDSFTVTITIGKAEVPKLEKLLPHMLPKTAELWKNRYPCGNGGWIHYPVVNDDEILDIKKLIGIKKKPQNPL